MSTTSYPHLTVRDTGAVHIGNSRYQVKHLAAEHYSYGWTAEELMRQHPDLRPEEVYSALAYFYDHYDQIVDELKTVDRHLNSAGGEQTLSRADLLKRRG
jgi:uncharacterized protein (DUF433 family)